MRKPSLTSSDEVANTLHLIGECSRSDYDWQDIVELIADAFEHTENEFDRERFLRKAGIR